MTGSEERSTPPQRRCPTCGGEMRRSHVAYLGRGQEATVFRCVACGSTEQGPPRDRTEAAQQRDRSATSRGGRAGHGGRGGRRPLDEGGPENPVIDSDMARLLRERFGGGEPG